MSNQRAEFFRAALLIRRLMVPLPIACADEKQDLDCKPVASAEDKQEHTAADFECQPA